MRAVVLRAPGSSANFYLADVPMPELRPGDVRVKVRAIGFNPVDYQVRKGLAESKQATSPILGRDLSGVVDAVHDSVTTFRPGDEVYSCVCNVSSNGTYAEYVCVPEELLARKPIALSHCEAAAIPVAGITASLALEKAKIHILDSVFIAGGAGGVGSMALMLLKRLGVRRIVTTAGNSASRSYLTGKFGLRDENVLDYKDARLIERAIEINGDRFDYVLDLVGGKMLSACCRLVDVGGNLVSVTQAPTQDDFEYLFEKNASFHPIGGNAYSLLEDRSRWIKYHNLLTGLALLFDSGALTAPTIVNMGSLSVEAVTRAHDMLENSSVQGKLVMQCP